ncbi:MAG: purine-nucleoside phosphorylase [Pseudomonadota bacterium]
MDEISLELVAGFINDAKPDFRPRAAVVLGSGLGAFAERLEDATIIPYLELADFPEPGVEGHHGRLVLGYLHGVPIACLQGRGHAYEGKGFGIMSAPIRTMKRLGCEFIYLTCAAGSLHTDLGPGSLMMITDHINLMGGSPLVGENDPKIGPRFPSLENAYDDKLCDLQRLAASELNIDLAQGVYAAWLGPAFETPAEIRMIQTLGGDAVGMSIVPECLLARHCGMRVTATAAISNHAVGISNQPVDHAQTLRGAAQAADSLQQLITAVVATECGA